MPGGRFFMHYGDLTDATNLIRIVQETQPDEIYNLAAQSHVQVSFETPEYTANADALGTLRLLEAMRILGLERARASTRPPPARCSASCRRCRSARPRPSTRAAPTAPPRSTATGSRVNYREAYGLHASNGILFNHESPIRGETFVTRKITRAVARIALGLQDVPLPRQPRLAARLGPRPRLRARHAPHAAAGRARRLRHRHRRAAQRARVRGARLRRGRRRAGLARAAGRRRPAWSTPSTCAASPRARNGRGDEPAPADGQGPVQPGAIVRARRPALLPAHRGREPLGDATKARERLGWEPTMRFAELVSEMVACDLVEARRDHLLNCEGFTVKDRRE